MSDPAQEPAVVICALSETAPGEQRVALAPESVPRLARAQVRVLMQAGAGSAACFPDSAYEAAGAEVVSRDEAIGRADILVGVAAPGPDLIARLRAGQAVIGMLRPLVQPELIRQLAAAGVTAISLDGIPRTVSRAQSMDALTSQANVAGYKAVLLAADNFGRFFPMLITAAGTSRPASVLVLGAGVAGLQAMGTARRLGAVVTGYDVRPETQGQVESVGARFLKLESVESAAGEGGYARELTADEHHAQQAELAAQIAHFDVVITTAQVPGRRPPVLVTAEAVKGMQAGAILVDLAASSLGGNIEGSVPDQTVITENGVRIIGAGNLPAQMPTAASAAYSHNIVALLAELVRDGALTIDPGDEIQAGVVITHQGKVIHPAVAALLEPSGLEPSGLEPSGLEPSGLEPSGLEPSAAGGSR
jgi:H+-translocating NAD(P) transhydrogenase subunit alpha